MILQQSQWDPILMDEKTMTSIYNAVSAQVGPREGQLYIEARKNAGEAVSDYDRKEISKTPGQLALSFAILVSCNLTSDLGSPGEKQSDDVRKAYEIGRDYGDEHYDAQVKKAEPVSPEDRKRNALVLLHKAALHEFYTQLIAHLPQ